MTRFIDRRGTDGVDRITIDALDNRQITIYGLGGDDVLIARGVNNVGTVFYGGAGNDYMQGGDGTLYWGSDFYGGYGIDTMVGGIGADSFHVDNALDVVRDATVGDGDYVVTKAQHFVLPKNIENLFMDYSGPNENLSARGNVLANELTGLSSDDNLLVGLGGNDTLDGGYGGGHDTLVGGLGADYLNGSMDTIFRYDREADSCVQYGIDRIRRMSSGDRIDLSRIDADTSTAGVNDSFVFINNAGFSANATGQVRYVAMNETQIVIYVSTDADADAEMEIILIGQAAPTADDFIL